MIRLVIDSTCDLPKALIEKYRIAVIPLQIQIGSKSYRDGVDLQLAQLYEVMRLGIMPQTSQINLSDTEALMRGICEDGDEMIYLCFSSSMSGTYQAAQMVIAELRSQFPQRRLKAVDSQGGCIATGLVAMQTARWIAAGRGYEEILSLMSEMLLQVQHLFTLDSLNWLAKGGRILRPAGFVGDKLQIKPILDVQNGGMHIVKLVRGRKHTMSALVAMLLEQMKGFPTQLVGIAHASDPEVAQQLAQTLHEQRPEAKTLILPIGCTLGCHLGIGGVGLFFLKSQPRGYDLLAEPDLFS